MTHAEDVSDARAGDRPGGRSIVVTGSHSRAGTLARRPNASGAAPHVCWVSLGLAAAIDLAALAVIAVGGARLPSYVAAVAIHIVAFFVAFDFDHRLVGSRRALAGSLVFALPVAGVALAALALAARQRASVVDAIVPEAVEVPAEEGPGWRKLADAISPCEVLSADGKESAATLAALTRRGDAESVKLLRWLVIANPRMAVDAALAIEELSMRFDTGLDVRRAALARRPSAALAHALGSFVTDAMASGLVEPVMLATRAAEARQCFALANRLEPARRVSVTLEWVRMELAAMQPETALQLIEQAFPFVGNDADACDALVELRAQARFSAHAPANRGCRPLFSASTSDARAHLVA